MIKLLFNLLLCFALTGFLGANGQPIEPTEQSKLVEQVEQYKPNADNFRRIRIGLDYGFSTIYSEVSNNASIFGQSALVIVEYNLTKKSYLYSEFIYSGHALERTGVFLDIDDPSFRSKETEIKYESMDPCQSYCYVLGYGLRSNSDYTKYAWRFGAGAVYNRITLDELTVIHKTDSVSIPAASSSSFGLALMVGLEIPLVNDVFGFFSTVNLYYSIIGVKKYSVIQNSSFTMLGLYLRI